jgi:hypothetical protein
MDSIGETCWRFWVFYKYFTPWGCIPGIVLVDNNHITIISYPRYMIYIYNSIEYPQFYYNASVLRLHWAGQLNGSGRWIREHCGLGDGEQFRWTTGMWGLLAAKQLPSSYPWKHLESRKFLFFKDLWKWSEVPNIGGIALACGVGREANSFAWVPQYL